MDQGNIHHGVSSANFSSPSLRHRPSILLGTTIIWRRMRLGVRQSLRTIRLRTSFRPSSGTAPPLPQPVAAISSVECTACRLAIDLSKEDSVQVPCKHVYHPDCLISLVDTAIRSTTQFPPRCCSKVIPTRLFRRYLPPDLKKALAARDTERTTPRRVYCANPRCSHFLGPRDKSIPVTIYTCPSSSCTTRTCARCRATVPQATTPEAHVCTHDPAHDAALRLGCRMGWARCPHCEELIERDGGCAQMRCVCGTAFCYNCGAKYDKCVCHERPVVIDDVPGGKAPRKRPVPQENVLAPIHRGVTLRRYSTFWTLPTETPYTEDATVRPELRRGVSAQLRRRENATGWNVATALELPPPRRELVRQVPYSPSTLGTSLSNASIEDLDPVEGLIGSCIVFPVDQHFFMRGRRSQQNRQDGRLCASSV